VKAVKCNFEQTTLSDKMKALLSIAGSVQKGGKNVTIEQVEAAKKQGATDKDIHDTVLIAAAFCMFNRYQVFYTANALPQLPSEIIFNKIDFRILSNPGGKIPQDLLSKTLEVTLTSNVDQVYDQALRVKSLLKERFGISDSEMNAINIQIEKTEIDSLFTSDDHAISSSRLNPNIYHK